MGQILHGSATTTVAVFRVKRLEGATACDP